MLKTGHQSFSLQNNYRLLSNDDLGGFRAEQVATEVHGVMFTGLAVQYDKQLPAPFVK